MGENLRKKAELLLRHNPLETPVLATVEVQKLLHELDVYQIELQMQNEELRQAQLGLSEAHDTYVELFDFAPLGYLVVDTEGRIIEANFRAASLLGLERGKLLSGSNFAGFVHRDSLNRWNSHLQRLLQSPEKQAVDLTLQRPDGANLTIGLESMPRPTNRQYLIALTDITQRVQGEEALKKSEQDLSLANLELGRLVAQRTAALGESETQFRSTFNDLLVGVVVHAADSSILFSNPQANLLLRTPYRQPWRL